MAKKYRVTVEAMQVPVFKDLDGLEQFKEDFEAVANWSGGMEKWSRLRPIALDSGEWIAEEGDWIVKEGLGNPPGHSRFDVVSDDWFKANYEEV